MSLISNFFTPLADNTITRFRIALSILVLLHLYILAPHLTDYFSDNGYISAKTAQELFSSNDWSIFYYITSIEGVVSIFIVSCIAGLLLGLGIYPQLMSLVCYIVLTSFLNRFPNISYGGFLFLGIALLLSTCLPLGRGWTLPLAKKLKFNILPIPTDISAWAARMIQVEVCLIYLFAGLMKFQNPHWLDGSQLLYTLNLFGAHWNFTWLKDAAFLTGLTTIMSLVLELFFPIMIFIPRIKNYWIFGIICMHIGIALSMNVTFLGETMIGLLMIFI